MTLSYGPELAKKNELSSKSTFPQLPPGDKGQLRAALSQGSGKLELAAKKSKEVAFEIAQLQFANAALNNQNRQIDSFRRQQAQPKPDQSAAPEKSAVLSPVLDLPLDPPNSTRSPKPGSDLQRSAKFDPRENLRSGPKAILSGTNNAAEDAAKAAEQKPDAGALFAELRGPVLKNRSA